MLVRLIASKWATNLVPSVIEGDLSFDEILERNAEGYNVFTWPNYPSEEAYAQIPLNPRTGQKRNIKGSDVDTFRYVFVDFDLKSGTYPDKETFFAKLLDSPIPPSRVVDSGNGVHGYWAISDADAKSFLRLNRRLSTFYKTDPAVSTLNQIMRVSSTLNMKDENEPKLCETLFEDDVTYTAEQLDQWLPPITPEDEQYCIRHYDQCYNVGTANVKVPTELPKRFIDLCKHDKETASLYYDKQKDRSTADFNLGLRLFNKGFTKEDALAVMCRTQKAMERAPVHQYNYGLNIVDKIYDEEATKVEETQKSITDPKLKYPITSAADIASAKTVLGERIVCSPLIDATVAGFRRGQVLGLVAATGNGKSSMTLNILRWFAENNVNSELLYLYITLEMTEKELEVKWRKMIAELKQERPDVDWDRLIYFLGNFNEDGTRRDLGTADICEYAKGLEIALKRKIGVIAIDHIGILKQTRSLKSDEREGLIGVCKELKPLAAATDTFVIIQSQTSRAKADAGDVELDVSAAFGVSSFEWYVDHLIVLWQPLRRVYGQMDRDKMLCVTAFKMCKTRDKNVIRDEIQTDVPYGLAYDPETEVFREMTSDEEKSYEYWNTKATIYRNKDKKREPSTLVSIGWVAKKREKTQEESAS
jgi:hypothetical protein